MARIPNTLRTVFPLLAATANGLGFNPDNTNVYGGELQTCSHPGTAMTGFTRDGHCADLGPSDMGSHHICIQMKSDFCTVTGQPNWCTEREMPCMGTIGTCKIGNWCVCQWAFATYLAAAGGCDSIVDLVCNATHGAAYRAYAKSNHPQHVDALECIKKRCGIADSSADGSGANKTIQAHQTDPNGASDTQQLQLGVGSARSRGAAGEL